ncbi:helix-turn-helix domain-containing protein [Bradyrhizobium sp. SHOUNA76]|nr:helix-turn-helix domain-containing protein [Bradyrhizobium sp. SHOUNA76]
MGEPMFPSQARRARMCSLSERAVITHLHVAEQFGWIAPRKRDLKSSKWAANESVATWPNGVNDLQLRGEPRSRAEVNDVHGNIPVEVSNEQIPCGFGKFWEAYPHKVGKKACEQKWKSRGLDKHLTAIPAGLERWKASDRWKRGYVLDP